MVNMAILGFGTVGSGVAKVLTENAAEVAAGAGEEVRLKYIVDVRDMPDSPFASFMVKDFSLVEQDPEVSVVVETIGGCGVALAFTRRALAAGKHVITSNKQLVAEHGVELLALAKEKGVNYFFEASVGGGIPLLRPLFNDLSANKILSIKGIVNGTTNYILTAMEQNGKELDEALKEAQSLGYAELNPDSDLDGTDAVRKACILADLAWGRELKPDLVPVEGIRNVALQDIRNAASAGGAIKLLCRLQREEDGTVFVWVAPHFVPASSMLAHVDAAYNAVIITGNAVGDTLFYGTGAGSVPTASAVVGDVVDAVRHKASPRGIIWTDAPLTLGDPGTIPSRWYIRSGESWSITEAVTADRLPQAQVKYRVLD
ncbi:MAG: homoserine dehydrogenase [Oscillospiraceae bacterium]|nr:homoserine dehydrogenase [Oscillospiraceae bacterium]